MNEPRLMLGNEACVEGAITAGMRFYAGYPITPSTEIAERASELLPRVKGKFIQMEDEIASIAAILGASLAGLKVMTATSGPGFSLKQENIGYAAMAEIPCVIVNVQRGGPSTGLPTQTAQSDIMQSRWGTHGDHPIIVLTPSSVLEAYLYTIKAYNLAERFRTPVIFLMEETIGHLREKVVLPEISTIEVIERKKPKKGQEYYPYKAEIDDVPPLASFGDGFHFHVTGLTHNEKGYPSTNPDVHEALINRLYKKIYNHLDEIVLYEEEQLDDADYIIISYGGAARSARESIKELRRNNIKVGMFRP
ncbi:MAG: 2-oxoacid:acceptor oxidoreductase subunit alpha, partial [Thermoanaerobacteraceae bacterium]|nr:2-oxoacid:acceptor oxidoreductase subunit alpha [Thermoanaerobacteraceae bacterium]